MKKPKRQVGDPRRNYAKEWRTWRKRQGWTQIEMAAAVRLSPKTIVNIESGKGNPRVGSRIKMAELQKRHMEAKCT